MARSSRLESGFQDRLKRDLEERFPGCMVIKMDAFQGIPDLLILWRDHWAALECKQHAAAHHQPNQEYYVARLDEMSFAAFIYPENKEEVLRDLELAFEA